MWGGGGDFPLFYPNTDPDLMQIVSLHHPGSHFCFTLQWHHIDWWDIFLRFRKFLSFLSSKPQSLSLSSFACLCSLDPAHIPSCHFCWQVKRIGKQGQILPKPSGLNYSTTDAPAGIHNMDQDNRLLCWLVHVYHQRTSLKQRSKSWPWETAPFMGGCVFIWEHWGW